MEMDLEDVRKAQFHIYGGRGALSISPSFTQSKDDPVPTINIDAAPSTGPRQYNWNNKIVVQLTRAELPNVAACVFGLAPKCNFSSHGPAKDKGFSVEHQGDKVFISVFQKDKGAVAVPVMAPDAMRLGALLLNRLRVLWDMDSVSDTMAVLGRMASMYSKTRAA